MLCCSARSSLNLKFHDGEKTKKAPIHKENDHLLLLINITLLREAAAIGECIIIDLCFYHITVTNKCDLCVKQKIRL